MKVSALDVLAAFVAINTLMYLVLAVVKMLPRVQVPRGMRRPYARVESRSIFPTDPPSLPDRPPQVRGGLRRARPMTAILVTATLVAVICVVRLTKRVSPA